MGLMAITTTAYLYQTVGAHSCLTKLCNPTTMLALITRLQPTRAIVTQVEATR
jgi:hypothetical protein